MTEALVSKPTSGPRTRSLSRRELGDLSPEEIATPGLYVDRLVHIEAGDPPLKT